MSKPIEIKFKVNADETAADIKKVSESLKEIGAAGASGKPSEAFADIEATANNASRATREAANSLHDLSAAGVASGTASGINEITEDASKADAEVNDLEQDLQGMDAGAAPSKASESVRSIGTAAEESASKIDTLKQGMDNMRQKSAPVESRANLDNTNAAAHLDTASKDALHSLDLLLARYQTLEAELKSGGFSFVFDDNGATVTLADLEQKINKVYDASEMLGDQSSDIDFGSKWEKAGDDVDQIIDAHNKAAESAEISAEKEAAAIEKVVEKAEEAAQRHAEAQLLKTGSIEELEEQLEKYETSLRDAEKAEDKLAQIDLTKRIDATRSAIDKKTASINRSKEAEMRRNAEIIRSGSIVERVASEATSASVSGLIAIKAATAGTRGLQAAFLGAGAAARVMGTAIKSALGPLMLIMIALEAVMWALGKAWDALTSSWSKSRKIADETTAKLTDQAIAARAAAAGFREASKAAEMKRENEQVAKNTLASITGITSEYKSQTRELERQLSLQMHGLDSERKATEHKFRLQELAVKKQALDENWNAQDTGYALESLRIEEDAALFALSAKKDEAALKAARESLTAKDKEYEKLKKIIKASHLGDTSTARLQTSASTVGEAVTEVAQSRLGRNEAYATVSSANSMMTHFKDKYYWENDEGSELEDDEFTRILDLLSPLDITKNDLRQMGRDDIIDALRNLRDYSEQSLDGHDENVAGFEALLLNHLSDFGLAHRYNSGEFDDKEGNLDVTTLNAAISLIIQTQESLITRRDEAKISWQEMAAEINLLHKKAKSNNVDANMSQEYREKAFSLRKYTDAAATTQKAQEKEQEEVRKAAEAEQRIIKNRKLERNTASYALLEVDELRREVARLSREEDASREGGDEKKANYHAADRKNAHAAMVSKINQNTQTIGADGVIASSEIQTMQQTTQAISKMVAGRGQAEAFKEMQQLLRDTLKAACASAQVASAQKSEIESMKTTLRTINQQLTHLKRR